jgi:hypothetical protein
VNFLASLLCISYVLRGAAGVFASFIKTAFKTKCIPDSFEAAASALELRQSKMEKAAAASNVVTGQQKIARWNENF